jgi:D-alanyl-lipoteichoic acid acyltransferase DltB (MBOAT superfamily)
MKTLQLQQKAVRESRAQFEKTLSEIKSRTQFPAIAHEAVSMLNWHGKGSPLLVAGAAAGAAWIVRKFIKRRRTRSLGATKLQTIK